jgi:predicted AlkP superfamily pyrophosphatase or phosphodiesterase
MGELNNHLIIISFDGLSTQDFDYIKNLTNFGMYLEKASYCKKVFSVYPTLTYPAHATIVTGKYPKNHGIINNTLLQVDRKEPDWYWQRKYIKGDTIYDLAMQKGMKVAALLWPVTAKSKIQYNMPEVMANRSWQNQILVSLLNGSPWFQFKMNYKYGYLRNGINQPQLDNFTHEALLDTLKDKKPNLTLVHYTDLDSIRHYFGYNSLEAKLALQRHDLRLGDIINTLKENNMYENSTIIILGDHSSIDENKVINLNVLLKKHNYFKIGEKNQIVDYRAIVKNCDGSAYVYVKNSDEVGNVFEIIKKFNEEHKCIEKIYSKKEAEALGADPNCALMLEARCGYYFQDEHEGDVVVDINNNHKYTKATHGYSPFKEKYTTVFMASGKGIREGEIVEKMNLVDEGPTIAKLLDIELKDADGKVIESFLK